MYASIWQRLPGPLVVRLICALLLVAVVIVALFTVVFPWAERHPPFLGVTVDDSGG